MGLLTYQLIFVDGLKKRAKGKSQPLRVGFNICALRESNPRPTD
jgi:hypothetical protein